MLRSQRFFPLSAVGLLVCSLSSAADPSRIATFNVSLYGEREGEVLARLQTGDDRQAKYLAEIVQRVRPQVILLNEIDFDPDGAVLQVFCESYLAVSQNNLGLPDGGQPVEFKYRFSAPANTGRPSGFDLNRDGSVENTLGSDAYAADCWGYGRYPGQYGMAILSQFPIDEAAVRKFQYFRWKDMPGALLPDDPDSPGPTDWYPTAALEAFPLSSKGHWDVPVLIGAQRLHLLASHPTPPVYDGPEDRNGRRNHDEIRFWADYVSGQAYMTDDSGAKGPLSSGESFVILGDLNSDPMDGDGRDGISRLLNSPRVLTYHPPKSAGAAEQARLQGGANELHRGDPHFDTCDPPDTPGPGNLRIDYALPSADLRVLASGVFWPETTDSLFPLTAVHPFPSSDHRLVWVDLTWDSPAPR